MAHTVSEELNAILAIYRSTIVQYIKGNAANDYCTKIRAIEEGLINKQIIENWIKPVLNYKETDRPLQKVIDSFNTEFSGKGNIGSYSIPECKTALSSFTKFVLGYYKAYALTELSTIEMEYCKMVAQNALFCSVDVAEKVKIGFLGSVDNINNSGNPYYSWYCCKFQRQHPDERQKGIKTKPFPVGGYKPTCINTIILDLNTQAQLAIKNAIIQSLPDFIRTIHKNFEGYMACHIWDASCYDYRYHTSVFNLVLLPKSIGGLSDYSQEVKRLLEWESAYRFGVFPKGKNLVKPKYYEAVEGMWRQPDEHLKALNNQKRKIEPKTI